jgi:hypothetical protein
MCSEGLAVGDRGNGAWSAEDIATYKRLLDEQEAWELEREEVVRLIAEAEELRQDLETVVLYHLGKVWVRGIAPRLALGRRVSLKEKLLDNLRDRYDRIYRKKCAAGLNHESAHRATLRDLRRLSIKLERLRPEVLRKGPKPRSYHNELSNLLAAYERWLATVQARYPKIKVADCPEAELLKCIPEASGTRPSDRMRDGKVVPPFKLAALLACSELGIDLSLGRALSEIWKQRKARQSEPRLFGSEEAKEWTRQDDEEKRLKVLRDRFGPPPGFRDLWA